VVGDVRATRVHAVFWGRTYRVWGGMTAAVGVYNYKVRCSAVQSGHCSVCVETLDTDMYVCT